jgi:hypothetical protein
MTALRVFLVVCVFVMVGASADASASSTASGTWTLTVTFAGMGTGLVTTIPAGILCTNENPNTNEGEVPPPLGTCSAQFSVDVAPWVIASPSAAGLVFLNGHPAVGSVLGGMSNCVGEHGSCQAVEGQTDPTTEQVTFNPKPVPCIVNRLISEPLAQAKRELRFRGCKVGTIRYAYTSTNQNLRKVISQNPKPHWQLPHGAVGAVNLVVSKGTRGP